MNVRLIISTLLFYLPLCLSAQRVPVLDQIKLPHNYYYRELYLPQLTSGPSSATWSPDGKQLIYSMGGSLWKQGTGDEKAIQLTDDIGYDYQPDWSPDGKSIIFVRYDGSSCELMLLELSSGNATPLTRNKAVNLEPRWSPDGSRIVFTSTDGVRNFSLFTGRLYENKLSEITCLTPDRKSETARYYYSAYDHAINPTWSRDGKNIFFIYNKEIAHGTGDIVMMSLGTREIKTIHHEETNWRTTPDISPDGTRMVYSSYLGRNWHQLWLLPSAGGYPIPLTYGEFDNAFPRWSPDGTKIAFISNRDGNTSLWLVDAFDGGQQEVKIKDLQYKQPRTQLIVKVTDENGSVLPARMSVIDSRGKFYAPQNTWIHADDSRYPQHNRFETHYFHTKGSESITVPKDKIKIEVSHGPQYELIKTEVVGRK